MKDQMKEPKEQVLRRIVAALIDGWGYDSVQRALNSIPNHGKPLDEAGPGSQQPRKEKSRPSPTGMVLRQKLPKSTKALFLEVASQYESKNFLPTIADVRNFLEIRGMPGGQVKQRVEAFRKVLDVLLESPPERIESIIREGRRTGPSQLGPISDAIKAANNAIRTGDTSGLPHTPETHSGSTKENAETADKDISSKRDTDRR